MSATATGAEGTKNRSSLRVGVQKFGTFLSGMVMPNIPALIAWGIFTAFFIADGFTPVPSLESVQTPMIHYLLPVLIAIQGGRMIHENRGAVVAGIATFGVIAGSDWLIAQENIDLAAQGENPIGQINMFIGAMIMGPLAAWVMKKLDQSWAGKIKAGFEMLVDMFSAGILGFGMAIVGFFGLAPIVNWLMHILGDGVEWLIDRGLLPLTSILIEPAKVFFLNNAINHGALTPLGIEESAEHGKSVLFLLEANPGVGAGLLLAFTFFGVGAARASAPGALLIQFVGGIHEVYFPYVMMKPALLLAVIGGGMSGVAVNVAFGTGLRAPASPGSIIAVLGQTAGGSYLGVILAVIVSAAVTFVIAAAILRASRRRDLEAEAAGGSSFAAAVAATEANKGKSSSVLGSMAAGGAAATAVATTAIHNVIFACDAGMGSSAMGASVLRKKFKQAGITDIDVTNKAIANLPGNTDLVITQQQLTDRAKQKEPGAVHVSVDNFMGAPEYDQVVQMVLDQRNGGGTDAVPDDAASASADAAPATAEPAAAAAAEPSASGILTPGNVRIHSGSATRDEAIEEAASILVAAGAVTDGYAQAMKDREATVSTFMGNGLAIPHGTGEAKDTVIGSAISVARYDGGIDWGDGDQAKFVIGIAGKDGEHLTILAKVAELFSDEDKVAQLEAASTPEEIYQLVNDVNED
ncbi:PTS mannitol transporter subunit IICBA [Galactobacter sp.]|uniref:PTS mannitol transporter subunit IICBA n=1 Tax=Galactobacter sp. TaxID=2676125 RepID=UPI0025B94502|nr:PTS mannitol transporter subunit IICBA [Galactobacter sp.]